MGFADATLPARVTGKTSGTRAPLALPVQSSATGFASTVECHWLRQYSRVPLASPVQSSATGFASANAQPETPHPALFIDGDVAGDQNLRRAPFTPEC